MSIPYEKIELDDSYYINIFYDESSDSPREWRDDTKMCIKETRRHRFPNELDINFDDLDNDDEYGTDKDWKIITIADKEKEKLKGYHVYEMDCYEHSGIAFSLSGHGMQCRFDTSYNCWYFCVPEIMGTREECAKIASEQINLYNQYINWEVYCFQLMETFPPVEKDWKTYYAEDELVECECTHDYYDLKEIAENIPQEYREKFLASI